MVTPLSVSIYLSLISVYISKKLAFYNVKRFFTNTNQRRYLARIYTATLFSCRSDIVDVVVSSINDSQAVDTSFKLLKNNEL